MKNLPKKVKQWAKDAVEALNMATSHLSEEKYRDFSEDQRRHRLVSLAPTLAGMKRNINDKKRMDEAYASVLERVREDLSYYTPDEPPPRFEFLFLLCYLDAHIAFDLLSELKSDEVMTYIVENYEIPRAV